LKSREIRDATETARNAAGYYAMSTLERGEHDAAQADAKAL